MKKRKGGCMLYKLAAVPYLNALPLIHYLADRPTLAAPAALVRLLRIGEIDLATAPIVTLLENPNYSLAPGICIGSNGSVQSVRLFFASPKINIHNVKSIYLDMESRTSSLLLKVLLEFKYGRDLREIIFFHPLPPREMEAQLLIGDKAMKKIPEAPAIDLGQEWTEWTGLPFVYAAWISRHPEVSDRAVKSLIEARDRGVQNILSVIPSESSLPFKVVEDYLKNIIYHLGPKEEEGMALFKDYLLRGGHLGSGSAHLRYVSQGD